MQLRDAVDVMIGSANTSGLRKMVAETLDHYIDAARNRI